MLRDPFPPDKGKAAQVFKLAAFQNNQQPHLFTTPHRQRQAPRCVDRRRRLDDALAINELWAQAVERNLIVAALRKYLAEPTVH